MTVIEHIDFEVPLWGEFTSPPAAQPSYADLVLASQPVACWPLDEAVGPTASDASGNAINGTYEGPVQFSATPLRPHAGRAVTLNGSDARITVPNDDLINSGAPYSAKTCVAWFATTDPSARQIIFEQGGSTRGLAIYVDAGRLYVGMWSTSSEWFLSTMLPDTQPHMAALVFDGAGKTVTGYLDGVEFDQVAGPGSIYTHPNAPCIGAIGSEGRLHDGAEPSDFDHPFAGRIGDVSLFNTALDTQAISSLHRTGVGR